MSDSKNTEQLTAEQLGKINELALFDEMVNTPEAYGRYTDLYVLAEKQHKLAEIQVKSMYSRLFLECKIRGGSTDPGYRAMVESDQRYVEAQMTALKYETAARSALHKTKTIDKKLNTLRDLATRICAEMKVDPIVLANVASRANRG